MWSFPSLLRVGWAGFLILCIPWCSLYRWEAPICSSVVGLFVFFLRSVRLSCRPVEGWEQRIVEQDVSRTYTELRASWCWPEIFIVLEFKFRLYSRAYYRQLSFYVSVALRRWCPKLNRRKTNPLYNVNGAPGIRSTHPEINIKYLFSYFANIKLQIIT